VYRTIIYQSRAFGEAIHWQSIGNSLIDQQHCDHPFWLMKGVFESDPYALGASIALVIQAYHRSKFSFEADWRLFRLSLS